MAVGPSLTIGLAAEVTRARLTARPSLSDDLRRLAISFRSSTQRSPGVIEVEIDDLLTHLASLSAWPHKADGDVMWDPHMQALVVDSLHDAQAVSARLDAAETPPAVTEDMVPGLLGQE